MPRETTKTRIQEVKVAGFLPGSVSKVLKRKQALEYDAQVESFSLEMLYSKSI